MAVILCQGCGQYFEAKRSDAKWCPLCRIIKDREKLERYEGSHRGVCGDCGRVILRRSVRCRTCDNKARTGYFLADKNPNWRGGKTSANGYVYLRVGSTSERHHAYRAEHIVVWEKATGKKLPKGWVIHHFNGIRDDNRIENLVAMPRKRHNIKLAFEPYEQRIRELEAKLHKK